MADDDKRVVYPPPSVDPTALTTEALQRDTLATRELLAQRIETLKDLVFERVSRNREVCEENFKSTHTQLEMVERQRVEQKKDTKDAVDAALSAAKEAVKEQTTASEARTDKSEASMTKNVEQLGEKFDTAFEGLRRESSDLKDRLTAVEQQKVGGREATIERRAVAQPFQVVLVSLLGSIVVSIIIATVTFLAK